MRLVAASTIDDLNDCFEETMPLWIAPVFVFMLVNATTAAGKWRLEALRRHGGVSVSPTQKLDCVM